MTHQTESAALAALVASLLVPAAGAAAAPFGPATTVEGFGNQPALAQIRGASLTSDGASAIFGSSDSAGRVRAVEALGNATIAHGVGPSEGAFDLATAANANGDTALTFTVGHTAYLRTCHAGRCGSTVRVGTSALKPQSAVAVQPSSGRTTVLWRGRTSKGVDRLMWRITTGGRLGAPHVLGELGDSPRLATDASGKTVAVWLAHRRAGDQGVRTTARRAGEFLAPTTLTPSPAANLRLVSSDGGATVAAWLTAPGGVDVSEPSGTIHVASRTGSTAFGSPRSLGSGSTLSLAGSPDGNVVLVTDRHVGANLVVVSTARQPPGGSFGPFADLAPAQFVSDAFGAASAVADGGRALVTWASGVDPSAPAPSGIFAAIAEPSSGFGAPQLLAGPDTATLPQATAGAITPSAALVAWVGPRGGQLARAVAG